MSLTTNTLNKINKEKISPTPKWLFNFKNTSEWIILIFALLAISLSAGIIVYRIYETDFVAYSYLQQNFGNYILDVSPLLLVAIILLGFLVCINVFKNINVGYRYSTLILIFFITFFSTAIALVLYITGATARTEEILSGAFPGYPQISSQKVSLWLHPEQGLLAGEILEVNSTNYFVLKDFLNKNWRVYINEIEQENFFVLRNNFLVKVIGEKLSDTDFRAFEIKPWRDYFMFNLR